MPFALTNQKGMLQSTGPTDVCLTPVPPPTGQAPMPYPNIAQMTDADTGTLSSKVKIAGSKAAKQDTVIKKSSGDEAGTNGGVVSGTNADQCAFILSSMKVKIEGKGAVRQGDTTQHNGQPSNTVGTAASPSQNKVNVN